MKRLFIDANILLDVVLAREHEPEAAMELLALGERRKVKLVTTALSIGVVLSTLQRAESAKKPGPRLDAARQTVLDLLACVEVVPLLSTHFQQSVGSAFGDIEDGAQYFAAISAGKLDALVTRDPDFKGHVAYPILTASKALELVKKTK
ncbi:MAG: type II toxin-antitoxin system VapC family toxin [Flavobacteriales bacterium]